MCENTSQSNPGSREYPLLTEAMFSVIVPCAATKERVFIVSMLGSVERQLMALILIVL